MSDIRLVLYMGLGFSAAFGFLALTGLSVIYMPWFVTLLVFPVSITGFIGVAFAIGKMLSDSTSVQRR